MSSGAFQVLRLSRLFDAAFPIVSLCLGLVAVDKLDTPTLLPLVVLIVLFNSAAMIWNDIEDREVDQDNRRPEIARSGTQTLRRLTYWTIGLCAAGVILAYTIGTATFVLALATLLTTWAYNSRPVQASRRPIASLIVLSGAGAFLPYLFGLSVGEPTGTAVITGLFWWLGRISLSVLKDYKDASGDAKHNKRTFLLRFGSRKVAYVSVLSLVLGYGGFIAVMSIVVSDRLLVASLLIIGVGVMAVLRRGLFDRRASYARLDGIFRQVAQYQLLLDAGIVLWLI